MALYSSESNRAWVSFKDGEWLECDVTNSSQTQLNLRFTDGQVQTVNRTQCQFCYRNPSAVEDSDDFLTLPNLDEPNILHSLRVRYWKGHVYSYTGPILIAVNPWKPVDIYNINVLERHKSSASKEPHIFGVASKAFRELLNSRKNQCILISGESGSGKTESTKYVLQVLTASGENRTGASASIEQQVMLTNPVLEAFGNAKTLRNDNSSRFGKWINVHFDRKGTVAGAEIKTYLLEKARVVQQTAGERNYHVFYQVCCAAAAQKMLQDLRVEDASTFNYTKTCLVANNNDDTKSFDRTKQALHFIGFDATSQQNIFASISAILHIGNMQITEDREGNAVLDNDAHLQAVCSLLKVDVEAMKKGICLRLITAGTDVMLKPETSDRANQGRDAFAKALYSKLFDNIVKCVNSALRLKQATVTMQASVLDIFGFEVFQKNHFEQFCINYANEKLQLHFNHFNFMLERQLYAREGIELVESDFVDNSACVELIENKSWGVQAILDDVCIMPKGDDKAYLERLFQTPQMKTHPHFVAPKQRNNTFIVNHYAGTVAYTVDEFCEKNKDLLANDIVTMMQSSKNKFFVTLFEAAAVDPGPTKPGRRPGGGGGGSVAYKSVSATFKTDLQSLMEAINAADPHFVRCVNPNAQKRAELFEDFKAIEQLRCGGVIEAVRMCRESYPSRYTHEEFIGTFSCICPEVAGRQVQNKDEARRVCLAMVQAMKVQDRQYRLGSSMILLKREIIDEMERRRALLLGGRAVVLQNTVRRYVATVELAKKRENRRKFLSVVRIQAILRRTMTRSKYMRMVQAVRLQEKKRLEEEARKKLEEERARANQLLAQQQQQQQSMEQPQQPVQQQPPLQREASNLVAQNSRAAVLDQLGDDESDAEEEDEVQGYLEEDKDDPEPAPQDYAITPAPAKSRQLQTQEEAPPVSPLCIRIQVHAEGITEALLFHVDLLASAIRQAVMIKDHKSFLKVHPNTFRGQAAIEWLRGHAARALFGSEAEKEKNQQLSRSVALLLGQKLLAVGVFRQVTGSLTKPLEDPNALFRFHEDEKEGPLLNCRSIWFQNAREPLLVVSELLYTMLNLRLKYPDRDLRDTEELNNFTAAAAELQLVNINDLSRIQLLAFFLNAYNLMVLHAHVVRGSVDGTDFKSQKIPFTRDNQYMIAAYNYSLAEIEERLFCRVLRAKFPKKSDKSRAPEPRVHFALSLGCASSPRMRIYQPETLDEDLQQAAVEYLTTNAPKNRLRVQQRVHEVTLPKLFKWYKDDFGFSKQEILAYYASFMPPGMREEQTELARSNNFVIKYEKYDWNLHLTKACSEASRQPARQLIANSPASPARRIGYTQEQDPAHFGANQVFTPSLHEVGGGAQNTISQKVMAPYNPNDQRGYAPNQAARAGPGDYRGQQQARPPPGYGGAGYPPPPRGGSISGLQDDSGAGGSDGFMC
uniref:Myosin motor domain-containing protein n=1 Tax=Cryptomonas curvata TaxID=233186 RepID=A0A7S0QMA7_9CRYP|mmetsp:Transcript_4152/g.9218  ORF Transcript_4152/g.9218 Transcript_4152/m.9218 type:complete len:1440 (+) Transcript_4152:139-4458(+)|eukprot:CAMPEP_0172156898 /NCGR_PEP_ID=MMETSP1050-20130122/3488_1 /TAXON_ID=233186 /ORGANISM="Cryptomonas curvata, Strain CCAP979/52" /LENGTH=1439 /DNA_ID=CAMNT_0012826061 /DNA_START=139 /DNA_END=4458 /DNA_ORIENTATION=-